MRASPTACLHTREWLEGHLPSVTLISGCTRIHQEGLHRLRLARPPPSPEAANEQEFRPAWVLWRTSLSKIPSRHQMGDCHGHAHHAHHAHHPLATAIPHCLYMHDQIIYECTGATARCFAHFSQAQSARFHALPIRVKGCLDAQLAAMSIT